MRCPSYAEVTLFSILLQTCTLGSFKSNTWSITIFSLGALCDLSDFVSSDTTITGDENSDLKLVLYFLVFTMCDDKQNAQRFQSLLVYLDLIKNLINPPPWSGEGIIGMHFVSLSFCNISCQRYNIRMH